MKDKASSVIVEVASNNRTRGGQIPYEQEYNTGHGISAILIMHREIRREPCQPKVRREPVIYFWKSRWDGTVGSLSCRCRPPHSHPKTGARKRSSKLIPDAPPATLIWGMVELWHRLRLRAAPPSGAYSRSCGSKGCPNRRRRKRRSKPKLRADDLSRTACPGGCEGGAPQV